MVCLDTLHVLHILATHTHNKHMAQITGHAGHTFASPEALKDMVIVRDKPVRKKKKQKSKQGAAGSPVAAASPVHANDEDEDELVTDAELNAT